MKKLKVKTVDGFCKMQKAIMSMYETDVDYDHQKIDKYSEVKFVHINRGTGTSLIFMHTFDKYPIACGEEVTYIFGKANRMYFLKDTIEGPINHYGRSDPLLITYFDGKQYFEITYKEMRETLNTYKNKMIDIFRADDLKARYPQSKVV